MGPRHPFGVKESPADREARFRAWWSGLTPEQRRAEVKAGHVRLSSLAAGPARKQSRPKRTREAQLHSQRVSEMREAYGEEFVHLTPLKQFGVVMREFIGNEAAS